MVQEMSDLAGYVHPERVGWMKSRHGRVSVRLHERCEHSDEVFHG